MFSEDPHPLHSFTSVPGQALKPIGMVLVHVVEIGPQFLGLFQEVEMKPGPVGKILSHPISS